MRNRERAATFAAFAMASIIIARLVGCSVPGPSPEPGPTPPPPAAVDCDGGLHAGDVKQEICEDAVSFEKSTCGADGKFTVTQACPATTGNNCKPFAPVQAVLTEDCVSCHSGYATYTAAKGKIDSFIARITSKTATVRMPRGAAPLDADEIQLFKDWKAGGLREVCDGNTTPPPVHQAIDFPTFEQLLAADLGKVSTSDRRDTRWLIATDRFNAGASDDELKEYMLAANKATNMVSTERSLEPVEKVGPGIYRINIDDLGISAQEWALIEQNDQLQFESFTSVGLFLKDATGAKHLPWVMVDSFNDTILQNSAVYYALTGIPATLAQLEAKLGVDFQGDLGNRKAIDAAFNGSRLSPQANRLADRHSSNDGYFWITFDTGKIVSNKQSAFKNPCLLGSGCGALLQFAASETFHTAPNGMMVSALWNAAGQRLNVADERIVHDYTEGAPTAPTIINAISCVRCHSGGIIHMTDKIGPLVASGNGGFLASDAQIIRALFRPQAELDRVIGKDNAQIAATYRQLGIDPAADDPVNVVSDQYLGEWSLQFFCNKIFIPDLTECSSQLKQSQVARDQLAQLLDGGTATKDQVIQAIKQVKIDLRLFQDPL